MLRASTGVGTRRAFTLLELLATLAIIAALAAVVFPVFAQARSLRGGGCLRGQHTAGQAFLLYAQDYDQATPWASPGYAPYMGNHGIAKCLLATEGGEQHYLLAKTGLGPHANRVYGNMTYHGGKIMTTAVTGAIFWGTSWGTYSGDKITGIDSWYSGFNGSNYAATSDEYTGSNGTVGKVTSYVGHVIDTSAASGGGNTTTILNEVCKVVTNPDASGNGYYAVYTDVPRGNAGYCAYHSVGTCGGKLVQFAFFWKLDGDPGCDPGDTSGLHSQGLAALANVSGHELSEARSDPSNPGAWYDGGGNENGDKCAWTWGAPLVTFSNGTQWKIQGEWSNKAYTAGTGYPNANNQKGCLSGL